MPEACLDLDKPPAKSKIGNMTTSSYERISRRREMNWSRSNSIDVTYIPLVCRHNAESSPLPHRTEIITNGVGVGKSFCCFSCDSGNRNSCWKLKRKQIIWESSHASAKNRVSGTSTSIPTFTHNQSLVTASWSNGNIRPQPTMMSCNSKLQSTSLPSTPNLSKLRRPQRVQYKKLSLACDESLKDYSEVSRGRQWECRGRQHFSLTTKQLEMSATQLQSYASVCADSQQPHQIKLTAPMMGEQIAVKHNNNIEAPTSHRWRAAALSGGSTISTQTQTDLGDILVEAPPVAAIEEPTALTNKNKPKSSLAFCEHCCESTSLLSTTASNVSAQRAPPEESGKFLRAATDSVSDLSSFRFVSSEESDFRKRSVADGTEIANVDAETSASSTRAAYVASSSNASFSNTNCCYTIDANAPQQLHYTASAVIQHNVTAPVSIPQSTTVAPESNLLSTSLPRNYGSVRHSPEVALSSSKAAPPVPPKPCHGKTKQAHQYPDSTTQLYYDPNSFHSKVQKFEKQNTLIGRPSFGSALPVRAADVIVGDCARQSRLLSRSLERSVSPQRCELLNCFGTVKNIRVQPHTDADHDLNGVKNKEPSSVTRSFSDSSCCFVASSPIANEKCAINGNNHTQLQTHPPEPHHNKAGGTIGPIVGHGQNAGVGVESQPSGSRQPDSSPSNKNYNCKIGDRPPTGLSPGLSRRTLRYDSHGRLKADRVSQLPVSVALPGLKSLSETRLYHERENGCERGRLQETQRCEEILVPQTQLCVENIDKNLQNIKNGEIYKKFQFTKNGEIISNAKNEPSSENVEDSVQSNGFVRNNVPSNTVSHNKAKENYNSLNQLNQLNQPIESSTTPSETPTPKSLSESEKFVQTPPLPLSFKSQFPSSDSSISLPCKCSCKHGCTSPTSPISPVSPISPTSPSGLCLKQKHFLPSPPVLNGGSQSPLWMSNETLASRYSDQKCLDDVQSNCSDQTTIFHLDNECSLSATSSSSPSSQSAGVGNSVIRGPLLLKRIPAIQSFGYIPAHSGSLDSANVTEFGDKEISMEKRRNTLDRFQRLGFGRKTSPNTAPPPAESKSRKSNDKSERLKELTELLRGNRSSPTPPPVPPPRKPRNGAHSASSSFEKPDGTQPLTGEGTPLSYMPAHTDDILLMDQEEQVTDSSVHNNINNKAQPKGKSKSTRLIDTLKPNTSLSNIEALMLSREKSKSPPPSTSTDIATKLSSLESRTVIGNNTEKGVPCRSASFSQIDYTSGKYKKSAFGALRDRLRRDKPVESTSPTNSLVGGVGVEVAAPKSELKKEPDWIYIPLKKTELSINLNYAQESKCLEDVIEHSPDAIPEEELFCDTEPMSQLLEDAQATVASNMAAAHAKMESLSDTINSDNDYTIENMQVPSTVGTDILVEVGDQNANADAVIVKELPKMAGSETLEPNLATLMEEQLLLESPPDNFIQTATTCLIPVPVYECAAQEWRLENPPHEWVEVAPEEFGVIPETITPLISLDQCAIAQAETKTEQEYRLDKVPTISVSRSSEEADEKKLLRRKEETIERRQASLDCALEVKKRYSHDDMEIGHEKRSSLDGIATRYSADERKRIDKSKRRKGMYIENAEWTDVAPHNRSGLALDISIANYNAIKPDSPEEPSIMYINSPATDDTRTPGSLYSFDLNTPESECNKAPVWTKSPRLPSFSCQSSEEKEEVQSNAGSGSVSSGLGRQNKSFPYLRNESVSDNESDRTPPPSRDRNSPAPGDLDLKRYSKRPLRGPYGQMLEAEMKKPNRMHYEEILEELRESESTSQTRRQRAAHDDAGGGRNLPQHSNSMRVRKTNTYLPVPAHARAASTPSQIENVSDKSGGGMDKINPHEKRYQSSLDNSMSAKDYSSCRGLNNHTHPQAQQPQPQSPQQHPHQQREMKRAASEAPTTKTHHNKRSQSMSGGKSPSQLQHQMQIAHQQKRSLDVTVSSANEKGKALKPTPELLAQLLKGSSEKLLSEQRQQMLADTRTHVVQEIFRNEQSYVESLQTVVTRYFKVLKTPEHAGMIDTRTVDEIFFMVPDILEIHERFLGELKARLDNWDTLQKVGDAFMETFSKLEVLEVYTSFVNNCNRAKNAIRTTKHQRPSFAKFLESTSREHKGKLTLDNLLIKPVQKFPNYEMLFQRLIKHTDHDHPDQKHLQDVLKLVHDILVHINCKEREILENGQREATLRELEGVIEGITDLIAPDRQFLLFDLVSMPSGQGARKERGFFLFNDLLVLTSIKKRSGTIRKPNTSTCPGTVASTLDTNKYKFLTRISLDCLDIVKTKDENVRRIMNEIENLAEDCNKLQQITEITASLKYPHQYLEDVIRELHRDVQRQLSERQTNDAQLNMLELTVNNPNGSQKLSIVFSKSEKRTQWEETFNEAKQKLAATLERHPIPEFLTSIPIRKTRAGLQFTCAAATLSEKRDVWVCNSDGYVGQVCIMSLHPEPNVTSCNGVCNARILCVASVPAYIPPNSSTAPKAQQEDSQIAGKAGTQTSYTQQLREYRKSISPNCTPAPTMSNSEKRKQPGVAATGSDNGSGSDIQLDLNFSSSDDEAEAAGGAGAAPVVVAAAIDRVPSPAPSTNTIASSTASTTAALAASIGGTPQHGHQDSNPEEGDVNLSTMWIGTEDGCIHVYNSTDNIRIKKNRIKIEHHSAVYSILYLDNRVFVSLANGDICVYLRDGSTSKNTTWNTSSSHCLSIGTVTSPVTKLLNVHGKLWCSIQGIIKVLDIETLLVVNQIQISSDSKPITNMTVSNNYVWISIQNSAHIKCFHSNSHQLIIEVNLAPAVNKMLSNCDEIIRQHKAACLRVTSLLSCKDLIWIGTSAGVLLTIPAQGFEKGATNIVPTGIPHGHTGHVRFLTFVETVGMTINSDGSSIVATNSATRDGESAAEFKNQSSIKHSKPKSESSNILIISGGDGYEDFRNSGANSLSEIAGREDSTNHLLIWQI